LSDYNERWLTVRWDEFAQAVWMEWKSYAEGNDFRSGLNAGLALLEKKRASRWLADLRLLGPVAQDDQRWTNNEWFPRAVAGGVRWMAIVQPKAAVARLSVKSIMSKVNDVSLVTSHFDDLEAARRWLRSEGKT
jgi:hypothetical protein